ncbi:hypothetical protein BV22DRAFT_455042 [Leucogyrophana mollusca]|uniref:Uncharacterized protein n=1 Tax=Leucogyrophana mollusca TaxID=85980 RepID=A0ACB8BH81_9AGAM|nr:hypothetical protein BV22DRAFT_455042 [Leucogyrophana mollusca]
MSSTVNTTPASSPLSPSLAPSTSVPFTSSLSTAISQSSVDLTTSNTPISSSVVLQTSSLVLSSSVSMSSSSDSPSATTNAVPSTLISTAASTGASTAASSSTSQTAMSSSSQSSSNPPQTSSAALSTSQPPMSSSEPPSSAPASSTSASPSSSSPPASSNQDAATSSTTSTNPPQTTTSSLPPTSSSTPPTTSSSPPSTPSTSSTPPSTPSSSPPQTSSTTSAPSLQTDMPSIPTVTVESTVFIVTSNSNGQVITSAPSVFTETIVTTNSQGYVTTVTQAAVNPSLVPNDDPTKTSSFFRNTGAVVGVFVVVGLAAASIVLWILFAIRRRQRQRRIDQDTAVEAAVAAAGFSRAPLDDDDNDRGGRSPHTHSQFSSEMGQRNSLLGYIPPGAGSSPTAARPTSGPYDDYAAEEPGHFNPYAEYVGDPGRPPATRDGYVPARTASPPPGAGRINTAVGGVDEFGEGGSRERNSSYGHTPTYSAGSYEPLLAAYAQASPSPENTGGPPSPPPRNPRRLADNSPNLADEAALRESTAYASDDTDDRLDPDIRQRTRSGSLGSVNLRDEEDYSRPVLTVRNIPDDGSQNSVL